MSESRTYAALEGQLRRLLAFVATGQGNSGPANRLRAVMRGPYGRLIRAEQRRLDDLAAQLNRAGSRRRQV